MKCFVKSGPEAIYHPVVKPEPVRGIKPVRRLFELAPKVTGTNYRAIRAIIKKLKRRYDKLLDGAYSGYTEFQNIRVELQELEFELHFRREVDKFVKSGSTEPDGLLVEDMCTFWSKAAEKAKVNTFDHTHVGSYFWGKGTTVGSTSVSDDDLAKMQSRVIDMMIAYKIVKMWEESGKVKSEMRPIAHGGQSVSFTFVK